MEDGWDMVSMVREGFDLEELVVRTTIREQSLSLASRIATRSRLALTPPPRNPRAGHLFDIGEWARCDVTVYS